MDYNFELQTNNNNLNNILNTVNALPVYINEVWNFTYNDGSSSEVAVVIPVT